MNNTDKDKYILMRRDHLDHLTWMAFELKEYLESLRSDSCPICRDKIYNDDKDCCIREFEELIE